MSQYDCHLSPSERTELFKFATRGKHLARLILHAWILLRCDEDWTYEEIQHVFQVSAQMVLCTRRCYRKRGIASCLSDRSRSGAPRRVTSIVEAEVTALVCSKPPQGRRRWTLDLLVKAYHKLYKKTLSKSSIRTILDQHHLKPWKKKMWCIPKVTPVFLERMYALCELFLKPYDPSFPVVCVDEKAVLLHAHVREPLPLMPYFGIREDDHYKRIGTYNIFVAVEPKAGFRWLKPTPHRKAPDYARFLLGLVDLYPDALRIHLVADNLNIHLKKSLEKCLGLDHPLFGRVEFHYTPTHASWLNPAEVEIGVLSSQCINRRFEDLNEMLSEIRAWEQSRNQEKAKLKWTYTREKAEKKFAPLLVAA